MRLVVHMGATKAASSFLQRCLFLNETVLRRHGVYLPKAGRLDPSYELVAHHNLGWEMLADPSFREARGGWEQLAAELATVDTETVLLSSESFARLASDAGLRSRLAERLHGISDDVTLVYVVRDPLARINSMFAEHVRAFGTPLSFDDYSTQSIMSGYYNLEETFRFWYESDLVAFVALRFDEMVGAGPFDSLLAALDTTVPAESLTVPGEAVSSSPGPIGVEVLRLLNAQMRVIDAGFSPRSAAARRVSEIAERRAAKLGWYDAKYWGWTPKHAEWAAGKLEASNQAFARAVWGTDWPLASLVARRESTANLIGADRKTHNEVLTFLGQLSARYVKLASAERAADEKGVEPAVDVVDASTLVADEAERAAHSSTRRLPRRPPTG